MNFYHVKSWEKFQHYKDRNPPWIKLHFELLSSMDWVVLDDASRVLAVACMLIASRNNGRVPADPHYLKRVAYLNQLPNFKPLVECGFLENLQADASEVQAPASTLQADARPETETETYRKIETSKKETVAAILLPHWLPLAQWDAFKAMRKKSGKPMTPYAEELAIKKLEKFHLAGKNLVEILNYNILNNYQGIFEPKENAQRGLPLEPKKSKNRSIDELTEKEKIDYGFTA